MSEVQKKTLGLAILSLVFGIFCLIPLLGLLFVLPTIVLGIVAMLAAIAIPNLLRARANAYDTGAKAKIKTIATALESYKAANGRYPLGEYSLTTSNPPFTSEPINGRVIMGYEYELDLNSNSYVIIAQPQNCGTTGSKIFKMTNDSELQEEECKAQRNYSGSSKY